VRRIFGIALVALLEAWGVVGGEEVPSRPFLRIETEMHTAAISRIDVDAAGRFLVSGSGDKTVRVWDLASGQLLRTLRPPIGEGAEGKIYAVAISPDGELVAAGGWTGYQWSGNVSIYLFERRSGRLLRRLSGLPNLIKDLAFSSDGARLAATLDGPTGLRVFRMPDGRELGRDADYGDDSYGAAFATDGRLVTTSYDGKIRIYDRDLHLLKSALAPGGKQPFGVAFSPDGQRIAVGYDDVPRVDVLDATDLRSLYVPDARGANNNLVSVTWSADGTALYAAGRFSSGGKFPIRRWKDAGHGAFHDLEGPADIVMDLRSLPQGHMAFSSALPSWGVLNIAGKLVLEQRTGAAGLQGLILGSSGNTFGFAYETNTGRPAQFSVLKREIALDPPDDYLLDEIKSGDGRVAGDLVGDGIIRVSRADNGKELLAFFPHADGKRWVLWTPSGYYDASVDGEDLIGWHVNNGPDREADFFSAWHFRDRFRKPEVIDLILETLDEGEALRRAGIRIEAQRPVEIQKEELPPVVTILDPADGAEVTASTVKIRVNVRSPSGKPVTRVWAKVDGQAIESRAAEYVPSDSPSTDSTRDFERNLEVPLPPGDHIIEALADVAGRVSTPARIAVKRKAQAPPVTRRLFALVVGIAEYAKEEYKLSFADDDARAVATLLRGQKGKTFETVEVRDLIDQAATLDALIDGLQWLDETVGPEDTAVVFFAGHGVNDREYFFLPYDANLARPVATMLSQSQLQGIITRLRGQVLLFLDTCRAGAVFGGSDDDRRRRVDVTALVNGLTTSPRGLVVFSAAQGRELSQERRDWGHGAFTKALLEALQGGADTQGNRNGEITIAELDSFLTDRVRELTDRAQTPIQIKSPGVPIFTFLQVARP
jgi:DNA-binding beta-propeller fold protein YncE